MQLELNTGQIVWPSPSSDEYKSETEKSDFEKIINDFASIKARKVLFLLACYST